ncbi:hypothetical protein RRF57_001832 [Xylaria bambusicola]|uniref:Nuclear membrane fusion protein Kar5 n=1 Tax=Xylaria bambusicola TaxID=326684 RepID=A0AAN7Z175_9PEZI
MGHHISCFACIQALLVSFLIHSNTALTLSWRGGANSQTAKDQVPILDPSYSAPQLVEPNTQRSTSYELALNELKELEFEPLCHRIAARLLVNNCQVLEGKDEATLLTDSGRKIRDFVDSYAASLAICDLERGNFEIPRECAKFQETALTQLQIRNVAHLHVTSGEIDACLSGLGTSDSAWSTWVSYRHKALRFCEAARADNEKAQNIVLFQRLTRIMSKLSDDVDIKIEQRMNDIDMRAQAVGERFESLSPLLLKLQQDLENANLQLSHHLLQGIKKSQEQVNSGITSAVNLDRLLQQLSKGVAARDAETAALHSQSLQLMNQQAASEIQAMTDIMAAAVGTTMALQSQIETSRIQAAEFESRQDNLEQGMQRLIDISDTLASKYDVHTNLLEQAQNATNEILDILEDTAASATAMGDIFLSTYSFKSWWPHIWCPVVCTSCGFLWSASVYDKKYRLACARRNNGFNHLFYSFLLFRTHSEACKISIAIIYWTFPDQCYQLRQFKGGALSRLICFRHHRHVRYWE